MKKIYAIEQRFESLDNYLEELEFTIEYFNGVILGGKGLINIESNAYLQYEKYFDDFMYSCEQLSHNNCYYKNIEEIVNDYFEKTNGEKFNDSDITEFNNLYNDFYFDKITKNKSIAKFLEILSGKEYEIFDLYGVCQGDYAVLIAPKETSTADIRNIKIQYFGCGTEFALLFGDGTENITAENCNNFDFEDDWIYYDYYNTEEFKKHLSNVYGVEIDNITVFIITDTKIIKHYIYGED